MTAQQPPATPSLDVAGTAHEINNALHVILNALELLRRSLEPVDPELQSQLDLMVRNAERAAGLSQSLEELGGRARPGR